MNEFLFDALQSSVQDMAMKRIHYHEYTLTPLANVITYLGSAHVGSRQEIILYLDSCEVPTIIVPSQCFSQIYGEFVLWDNQFALGSLATMFAVDVNTPPTPQQHLTNKLNRVVAPPQDHIHSCRVCHQLQHYHLKLKTSTIVSPNH